MHLLPHLFRTEYQKIIAVLYRHFGLEHMELAEDIASETFLQASETWRLKGLPENPTAWLYTVAKNKTRDHLKRVSNFNGKITDEVVRRTDQYTEPEINLSEKNITDSQLQMMFAVCHPSIPAEAQIGLSLRVLCGFGIGEIADAFLTNKETIAKRLTRAKEKLRTEQVKIMLPGGNEINARLDNVLTTLYLLFNEGYYSASKKVTINKELCVEAMRLTYLLLENEVTATPSVSALLALMCFHSSRFDARSDENGDPVLYDDQDPQLWNNELIALGNMYLENSKTDLPTKYHYEAAIAQWHTIKTDEAVKWDGILQLYNQLLLIEYSPIAALNRTFALSRAYGKEAAIPEAEKLKLGNNHLYFMLLADLYTGTDKHQAVKHLEKALTLARSAPDKKSINTKISNLKKES